MIFSRKTYNDDSFYIIFAEEDLWKDLDVTESLPTLSDIHGGKIA